MRQQGQFPQRATQRSRLQQAMNQGTQLGCSGSCLFGFPQQAAWELTA
jgi:hypothetical protein